MCVWTYSSVPELRCDLKGVAPCYLLLTLCCLSFFNFLLSLSSLTTSPITASILFLIHLSLLFFNLCLPSSSFPSMFLPMFPYPLLSHFLSFSPSSFSIPPDTHTHTHHFLISLVFSASPPSPVTSRPRCLMQRSLLKGLRKSWRRRDRLRKKPLVNSHRSVCKQTSKLNLNAPSTSHRHTETQLYTEVYKSIQAEMPGV